MRDFISQPGEHLPKGNYKLYDAWRDSSPPKTIAEKELWNDQLGLGFWNSWRKPRCWSWYHPHQVIFVDTTNIPAYSWYSLAILIPKWSFQLAIGYSCTHRLQYTPYSSWYPYKACKRRASQQKKKTGAIARHCTRGIHKDIYLQHTIAAWGLEKTTLKQCLHWGLQMAEWRYNKLPLKLQLLINPTVDYLGLTNQSRFGVWAWAENTHVKQWWGVVGAFLSLMETSTLHPYFHRW